MAKTYSVQRSIHARPERIWSLLTDPARYTSWNPAVVPLQGKIAPGETLKLVSAVNPKRTFSLNVTELEPERRMVWSAGMPLGLFKGVQTFSLRSLEDDRTEFSMEETYTGALAGLITRAVPDLTESFGQFADGLKVASESAPS